MGTKGKNERHPLLNPFSGVPQEQKSWANGSSWILEISVQLDSQNGIALRCIVHTIVKQDEMQILSSVLRKNLSRQGLGPRIINT